MASLPALHVGALQPGGPGLVTLSIVGTNDLHGNIFERNGRGGLAVFGGYVNNLRAARRSDGGAVLLIDVGDTYKAGSNPTCRRAPSSSTRTTRSVTPPRRSATTSSISARSTRSASTGTSEDR